MASKKVVGVGGIFFKSKDPAATRQWYSNNLGFATNDYGSVFESRDVDKPDLKNRLQWAPFSATTTYFEPSTKDFMVNFIVENMEELVVELKQKGVTIVDDIESFEYGKFIHILDNDGNKIQLWEPNRNRVEKTDAK
jgi:predicted enzyme related to lactoylglutathione lyase